MTTKEFYNNKCLEQKGKMIYCHRFHTESCERICSYAKPNKLKNVVNKNIKF